MQAVNSNLNNEDSGVLTMLVICEECAKKYEVDETQIKGLKARFTCQKCGHGIIVCKNCVVEDAAVQPEAMGAIPADSPQ